MAESASKYVPAMGVDWLLPLYDPLCWLLRADRFKRRLVEQARIGPRQRVLDLGCGTATLTLMIKRAHPEADVVGLDGDPKVLAIARRKVARSGLAIELDCGMAFALPYPDASFDRVLSSLVFHHLTPDDKLRALREVVRVLRPGGELHVADFGGGHGHSHGHSHTRGQNLVALCSEAGLADAAETSTQRTFLGSVAFTHARRV